MTNQIIIDPANDDMKAKCTALKILNDFAALGFDSRGAFMAIACHYFPKYKDGKQNVRLSNWWYTKFTDVQMNEEMETVLNKLRYE